MGTSPLAAASNTFGFDLWSRIRSKPGNLALSPASISAALALTSGGAKGDTAAEIRRALRIDPGLDADAVLAGWGELAAALQDKSRLFQLRIANRLFGDQRYSLEPAYLARTRAAFGAAVEPLDFAHSPEPARAHINRWVEERTDRRITELLPPGSLRPDTRLVLANAIYFLADWAHPFDEADTAPHPFWLSAGESRPAMLMSRRSHYLVARTGGVSILSLPYAGDAEMLIVLPDQPDGLPSIESSVDAAQLTAWRKALVDQELRILVPRFRIDPPGAARLAEPLQSLGISHAFDRERADFTAIANPPSPADRLCLGQVFHKSFVKVDEKGTEAAAVTTVEMILLGARARPVPELRVDRPFLFFIIDDVTGLLLFMGRVTEPELP